MKTKALTGIALLTALQACGGGGGSGGGGTGFTPIQVSNLGSISTTSISNGFASAVQQVAGDGLVDAKESLSIFKWVDANADINTTELAKYNVTVNGTTMSLQEAWFMLKGYKKLYYDGKETFWNNMVNNKQYDDTDSTFVEIKAIAQKDDPEYAKSIGKGSKTVEDFKAEKGVKTLSSTATNTITTDSDPVVGSPTVTTTYVDATADTVLDDGRTKREVTRNYTHTSKTPSTVTTTTYTQYTYTYSDGTKNVANGPQTTANNTTYTTTIATEAKVISTTYIAASVVESNRVDTFAVTTTDATTTIVGDPIVTTTYSDTEDTGVVQGNGDKLFTTTRTYTDKSTVTTDVTVTTTQTSIKTTTITYSNGTTEAIVDSPIVTVTPITTSTDVVTNTKRTEVLSSRTVKAKVTETGRSVANTITTSDAASTNSTPVTVTTYVDEEDSGVLQGNGDKLFTTVRTFTDTTTTTTVTTTVTTTNTTPVTTITYSNGTTEIVTGETVITTTTATESAVATPVVATRTETLSTRTVQASASKTITNTSISYGNSVYSHLDIRYSDPVTTVVDSVVFEGTWKVTNRTTTVTKKQFHTHYDDKDRTTVTTYSDGTKTTITDNVPVSRGEVEKDPIVTTSTIEVSRVNTDDGNIGEDHVDMGTKTPGFNSNASFYETNEYSYISNKQLSLSNFSTAYSRGWTGKGSLITIADTGANVNHVDLDDNIKYTKDYTGTTIDNSASHGTHVAGIAAGEKNNVGMHGAAFDADLAIAKVSSGYRYSFQNARFAAAWGRDLGSVAINVSAELNYDNGFKNSIVKKADGDYYSTHYYYGINGYNGAKQEADLWKSALGTEQVLVKAAGNAGYDYSAGMNQMATATDTDGNLILDGQMIIVGRYNNQTNDIARGSNKAGTICTTYQNNICIDAKKIKDFFIMADGTNITSTAENGGYVTMTGTSMSAPVVTGSIAVLHQMWPHMKGKHLVQLVLVTGNKNIAGYNENVHGQGLLDMDKATRPVGATGIPTTGRTNGGVSNVSGGANVSGVASSQIQALTSVMVLDSFERDFYIDLGDMAQSVDTRTVSVAQQMGAVNYFSTYMDSTKHLTFPKYTVNENSSVEFGFGASDDHYLGNSFTGTLGTTLDSSTLYANYNYNNGGFYAQAGLGYSTVNFDTSNSMLTTKTTNVISSTATVGYEFKPADGHKMGFNLSQPVTIEDAKLDYNVPTSRSLDGTVNYANSTVNFKSAKREIDLGAYYSFKINKTGNSDIDNFVNKLGLVGNVNTFGEIRTNVSGLQKEIEKVAGFSVQLKF